VPRMTGKRAMLEQLVADGVRHIFGNPGTTEQGFMDMLQEYPQVEFVLALHEGVAVSMADTFARLTRRPAAKPVGRARRRYARRISTCGPIPGSSKGPPATSNPARA